MSIKNWLVSFLFLSGFIACSDELPVDKNAEIRFDFPRYEKSYYTGDTIWIKGTVTCEINLHGYEISLKDTSTNINVLLDHEHIDSQKIGIDDFWVNTFQESKRLLLTISVIKNHETDERETKQFYINCEGK